MIERQMFVTWYTPKEKLPAEDVFVVVTISGSGPYTIYDHTLMIASWAADDGWTVEGLDTDTTQFTVHAWCDLEPYQGIIALSSAHPENARKNARKRTRAI